MLLPFLLTVLRFDAVHLFVVVVVVFGHNAVGASETKIRNYQAQTRIWTNTKTRYSRTHRHTHTHYTHINVSVCPNGKEEDIFVRSFVRLYNAHICACGCAYFSMLSHHTRQFSTIRRKSELVPRCTCIDVEVLYIFILIFSLHVKTMKSKRGDKCTFRTCGMCKWERDGGNCKRDEKSKECGASVF